MRASRWGRGPNPQTPSPNPDHATPALEPLAAGAALIGGWALRLYHLGWQSFWYDEGTSITVAPRDLPTILASAAADIHPPLYYLLLHGWVGLTGSSEYAARLPSALLGTLLIALLFRLGRDLVGAPGGAAAALLAAGAPLPIWYSQEARMYALATTLGALATLLLVRALARPGLGLWVAYAAALAGALYSHYFAAALPLAHGLAVGLWTLGRPRLRLPIAWRFAAAGGLAGATFLPWLARTYGQLAGWPATSTPFGPGELVARALLLFARGYGAERLDPGLALPLGAALALGLGWLAWRRREAALVVGAYLLVPLALMMYLSLSRPFFHSKFVLLVAPAAELSLAAAAVALGRAAALAARRRAAGPAAVALAIALTTLYRAEGVRAQYLDPRLARDDYRGLARAIEA
ncbi:MAG TPA: glycosyltransferase family 39 protein, partial [Chloroflexota bacterium]